MNDRWGQRGGAKSGGRSEIRSVARKPIGHAAFGLASVLAAGSASAQTAEGTVDLPQIEISGEGQTGYQTRSSGVARIATPLIDTPQTVTVVPQQLIQERRATTLEEALRNVGGVTFSAGEGGQQGDSPVIRGFSARGDIYRDGVRDPGWYTRDLSPIESVEVFKGPSGFAFGRGATGAAINNNTKLPLRLPSFVDAQITTTTGPGIRTDIDAGGQVGAGWGRVVVFGQSYDTPDRNSVYTDRWGIAPSFTFDFDDKTKVTIGTIYQGEHSVPDYGLPWRVSPAINAAGTAATGGANGNGSAVSVVPVNRATFLGTTNGRYADVVDTQTSITTLRVEHQANDALKITNTSRYIYNDRFAQPTPPRTLGTAGNVALTAANASTYPLALTTVGREHWNTITTDQLLINQTDVNAKFDTFGLQHNFVAGLELSRQYRDQRGRTQISYPAVAGTNLAGVPVDRTLVGNPNTDTRGNIVSYGGYNHTDINTVAPYFSDQIKLNQYFELLGAFRYDYFDATYRDPTNATAANRYLQGTNNLISYRVGGVFHPTQASSLYVAYGTSSNPSAEFGTLTSGTVSLAPETNTNLEVGGKVDVFDGKLSLSAAYFHSEKENTRITSDAAIAGALPVILAGRQLVQGADIGVTGKLTDAWQVFLNYTYQDSEILSVGQFATAADRYSVGKRLPNTPPHSFNVWTTYDVTNKFTIGGGITYVSEDFANNTNLLYVPSYVKLDLYAAYKFTDTTTLQLNVSNVTDEMYYAQYYAGHAVPASGRWASLTLRTRF